MSNSCLRSTAVSATSGSASTFSGLVSTVLPSTIERHVVGARRARTGRPWPRRRRTRLRRRARPPRQPAPNGLCACAAPPNAVPPQPDAPAPAARRAGRARAASPPAPQRPAPAAAARADPSTPPACPALLLLASTWPEISRTSLPGRVGDLQLHLAGRLLEEPRRPRRPAAGSRRRTSGRPRTRSCGRWPAAGTSRRAAA